jgi:hypothetical protein
MKRTLIITVLIIATATLSLGQTKSTKSASMNSSEKEALIALEKQAWEAWKTRDGKFFESFLSEESIGVGDSGVAKKAMIVKDIAGPDCEVRSYSFDNYEVVMLDANTAILTYKADQDATCKGKAVPARVWASSVYIKRGGKWLNAFHQETPVTSQ